MKIINMNGKKLATLPEDSKIEMNIVETLMNMSITISKNTQEPQGVIQ